MGGWVGVWAGGWVGGWTSGWLCLGLCTPRLEVMFVLNSVFTRSACLLVFSVADTVQWQ